MTNKRTFSPRRVAAACALIGGLAAAGCVSPVAGPGGNYAAPIGNAPVTSNPTPYTEALVCVGRFARSQGLQSPRIAVGRIADYTGKEELEGGRRVTQGASLMAMSAFAKTGARLVERYDTSVAELELKYTNNRLIGDPDEADGGFRRIYAGAMPGSDFYLVGGITELNYNIRSSGIDAFGGDVDASDAKGFFTGRLFVMNVGIDLRLVDTQSLEVVDVISYQKQIIGREISAGYFSFLNNNVLDLSIGEGAMEPIQLAVRSVIERATLEMMTNLYGVSGPSICDFDDPLATNGATGDFTPTSTQLLETNNGTTRSDNARGNIRRDSDVGDWLRGRY